MNPFLYDFELSNQSYLLELYPSIDLRKDRIRRLITMVNENEENLCKVIQADFGYRNEIETQLAEILMIRNAADFALKRVNQWMKKRSVTTPRQLRPSKSFILPQPKGVVGIMSPWNYPLSLALIPIISAFAAGNRVWLKPSERSARTSGYLATLALQYFHPSELCVINGGSEVSKYFSEIPFHHLFFTGSSATGSIVAQAAGANLTPVTLELGGKSPAIIDYSAKLKDACERILYGKLFNGGQTCIAPDYILVPHQKMNDCIKELQEAFKRMYADDSIISHPIDDAQLQRWQSLIEEAIQKGCQTISLSEETLQNFPIMPTLVINPTSKLGVMREEIFGPILPIIGYESIEEVCHFVNQHPNPLSIYWFGAKSDSMRHLLHHTKSGGITFNDTLVQFSSEFLPFGGVGASGMGTYHGQAGFDTFSHLKPVFEVKGLLGIKSLMGTKMAHPPYGEKVKRLLKIL